MEYLEEVRIVGNDTDNNYTLLEVTTDKRIAYCKLPFEKILMPHSDKKVYKYIYKKGIKEVCAFNGICYREYFNMQHRDCK